MGGTIGTRGERWGTPTESEVGTAERSDLSSWLGESFRTAFPDRAAVSPPLSQTKTDSVGQIRRRILQGFILPPISG